MQSYFPGKDPKSCYHCYHDNHGNNNRAKQEQQQKQQPQQQPFESVSSEQERPPQINSEGFELRQHRYLLHQKLQQQDHEQEYRYSVSSRTASSHDDDDNDNNNNNHLNSYHNNYHHHHQQQQQEQEQTQQQQDKQEQPHQIPILQYNNDDDDHHTRTRITVTRRTAINVIGLRRRFVSRIFLYFCVMSLFIVAIFISNYGDDKNNHTTTNNNKKKKYQQVTVFSWDDDENHVNINENNNIRSSLSLSSSLLSSNFFFSSDASAFSLPQQHQILEQKELETAPKIKMKTIKENTQTTTEETPQQQQQQHEGKKVPTAVDKQEEKTTVTNSNNDDNEYDYYDDIQKQQQQQQQQKYASSSSPRMSNSNNNESYRYDLPNEFSTTAAATTTNSESNKNPELFGWSPDIYPNPLVDPLHCSISYISNWMETKHNITKDDNIRLCDPDWVLGGYHLEQIAVALYNFSNYYYNYDYNYDHYNNNHNHKHNYHHYNMNEMKQKQEIAKNQEKQKDSLPSPPQNEQTNNKGSIDSAADEDMEDTNVILESPSTWKTPKVELAVATVRKMNVNAVLKEGSYYIYEDEDDMVNDAAQVFARSVHQSWWKGVTTTTGVSGAIESSEKKDIVQNNNKLNQKRTPSLSSQEYNDDDDYFYQLFSNNKSNGNDSDNNAAGYGVLIFLSIQDRVCFISTGNKIASILPWWRLEHVVGSMKPDLRRRDYGSALLSAIATISNMIDTGPPTLSDRLHDFTSRFGVVVIFAVFTFIFGLYGEYRDRQKKWQYAELRSQLSPIDKDKARLLQTGYRTKICPICLENFDYGSSNNNSIGSNLNNYQKTSNSSSNNNNSSVDVKKVHENDHSGFGFNKKKKKHDNSMTINNRFGTLKRVDSFGIPLRGPDGKKTKFLRCGHIYCETCWKEWTYSGVGNPCNCPVCRQDVGKTPFSLQRIKQQSNSDLNSATTEESSCIHFSERQHLQQQEQTTGPSASVAAAAVTVPITVGSPETEPMLSAQNCHNTYNSIVSCGVRNSSNNNDYDDHCDNNNNIDV